MRVLIQRVSRASVTVSGRPVAAIGPGLLLFVGIGEGDHPEEVERLAQKVATLRVFPDGEGRMQRSVIDVSGACLVVPQFTLMADVRRGRRPSFDAAAPPDVAADRVDAFARALEGLGVAVARGAFREHMDVELVNDGPVTFWLDGALPERSGPRDTMPA